MAIQFRGLDASLTIFAVAGKFHSLSTDSCVKEMHVLSS